jgi:thioredoxin 2
MVLPCPHCRKKNRLAAADATRVVRCGQCKQLLAPIGAPLDADPTLFEEVMTSATVPILIDFWAAWCGPCRMAAPEVQKVASSMAGRALVLKVDTERHPALAARFGVSGIPNFVVLHHGEVIFQQAGVVPAAQMIGWLDRAEAQSPR